MEAEYGLPDLYFATGTIAHALAMFLGDGKRKWHPADFVPYFDDQRPTQTTNDHARVFMAMAEAGKS